MLNTEVKSDGIHLTDDQGKYIGKLVYETGGAFTVEFNEIIQDEFPERTKLWVWTTQSAAEYFALAVYIDAKSRGLI